MTTKTLNQGLKKKKGRKPTPEEAEKLRQRRIRMNRELERQRPELPSLTDQQACGADFASWLFEAAAKKFILFCAPGEETTHEDLLRRFNKISMGFIVDEALAFVRELDMKVHAKVLTISLGSRGNASEMTLAQSLLGSQLLMNKLRSRH